MQRPNEFMRKPGIFELKEALTGETRPYTSDRNEEYELLLRVGCTYWANAAQKVDARKNAESLIARLLYEDVLRAISGIRHAIHDGDQSAALGRLNELERSLSR